MYKIRDNFHTDSLKKIYLSIVYPHVLYRCALWGGAFKTLIESLFVAPQKWLRVMYRRRRYDHTNPFFFRDVELLKLSDIIDLQTTLFFHEALNTFPMYCKFQVITCNDTSRQNLRLLSCRTSHAQQSILVRGARHWNQLPHHIKNAISRGCLKNNMKIVLLSKYN